MRAYKSIPLWLNIYYILFIHKYNLFYSLPIYISTYAPLSEYANITIVYYPYRSALISLGYRDFFFVIIYSNWCELEKKWINKNKNHIIKMMLVIFSRLFKKIVRISSFDYLTN